MLWLVHATDLRIRYVFLRDLSITEDFLPAGSAHAPIGNGVPVGEALKKIPLSGVTDR